MNSFKSCHPIVNFIYFTAVIVFSCVFMHPVCIAISLFASFAYSIILRGKKAVRFNLYCLLPLMLVSALINPAFNHEGTTILAYLPSDNPLTLESIVYGIFAAAMLVTLICWFSSYNEIITSDKLIYLFGRIIPSLSLILSMTLRFVPRFKEQLKAVENAQRGVGRDMSSGSIIKRAKNGLTILSITVTYALENAIETADSMKSRGYGLHGRTAFSIFIFGKRDRVVLAELCALIVYVIIGATSGAVRFKYFPSISVDSVNAYGISVFLAYFALCITPIVIGISEELKWKAIKSSI